MLGLCGKFMFSILRNSQHIFQSDYHFTFLRTTHEVSSFSTSSPTSVTVAFIIVIFVAAKCHLIIILICIFLITNDVEQLFRFLFFHLSSWVKCLFISFAYFKNCIVVFLLLRHESSLHILEHMCFVRYVFYK